MSPAKKTTSDRPRATGLRLHTPNIIVGLRLMLAVVVFVILSLDQILHSPALLWTAAILFIIAAVTDMLDGILARRWNAVTRFGRIMDPLADKVLVIGSMILLTGPQFAESAGFLGWMVIVIITRELLVTSMRAMLESEGIDASANWSGKAKMIFQSISIPLILILLAVGGTTNRTFEIIIDIAAWMTTVISAVSATPYITRAIAITKGT